MRSSSWIKNYIYKFKYSNIVIKKISFILFIRVFDKNSFKINDFHLTILNSIVFEITDYLQ